jgi:hypothetical protein
VKVELTTLDFVEIQIQEAEKHLEALMQVTVEADLLKTLPYAPRQCVHLEPIYRETELGGVEINDR